MARTDLPGPSALLQELLDQIYNNIGDEDRAQAQAFTDTWKWDDRANAGYREILANEEGRFQPQLVELIRERGLHSVLREGSLLAYLVSIALRVTEIRRVLKRAAVPSCRTAAQG